jgi:hypothetical protein
MNLRRSSFFLALPFLSFASVLGACGGAIDSPRGESVDPNAPGSASPAGSSSGNAGGGGRICTAAPSCDPGDKTVASKSGCLQDDARCYQRSLCGQTITCTGPTAQCAAYPSCQPDWVEVPSCPMNGTTKCVPVTRCGATIYCEPDASQCDGLPECNPGDTKIASPSQCLEDDAVCYQRTACGVSTWCTGPSAPDAGPPPPMKPPLP